MWHSCKATFSSSGTTMAVELLSRCSHRYVRHVYSPSYLRHTWFRTCYHSKFNILLYCVSTKHVWSRAAPRSYKSCPDLWSYAERDWLEDPLNNPTIFPEGQLTVEVVKGFYEKCDTICRHASQNDTHPSAFLLLTFSFHASDQPEPGCFVSFLLRITALNLSHSSYCSATIILYILRS